FMRSAARAAMVASSTAWEEAVTGGIQLLGVLRIRDVFRGYSGVFGAVRAFGAFAPFAARRRDSAGCPRPQPSAAVSPRGDGVGGCTSWYRPLLAMYCTTPSGTRYQTGRPSAARLRQSVEEMAMAGMSTRCRRARS